MIDPVRDANATWSAIEQARRSRRRGLRNRPRISTAEAQALAEQMAVRHDGDLWAVVGELIAIVLDREVR